MLTFALIGGQARSEPMTDPDDTPWSLDDVNPGNPPNSIDEILSRPMTKGGKDAASPAQGQPGTAGEPKGARKDAGREAEKALGKEVGMRERAANSPLPPVETATDQPPQTTIKALDTPAPARATAPAPTASPAQAQAPAPTPRPEAAAAPRPAAAPVVAPNSGAAATESANAKAAPPAAPEQPVPAATLGAQQQTPEVGVAAAPAQQVPGKLYLPLKRYFETKGAVALSQFDADDRAALTAYYEKTVGEPLWVNTDGFNDAARALIAELQKADDWGLSAADYAIPRIPEGQPQFEQLSDAEVKLSLAAMLYARHARGDRIDDPAEQLSSYLDRKPQLIEPAKVIEGLASAPDKGAYLRGLHPKHPQFERLRQKLLALREEQRAGREAPKLPTGPKLTPGKDHPQIAALRKRLKVASPDVKADGTPATDTYFDEVLARAVMDYKAKAGLEPINATINDALRRSLNEANDIDEEALLANMEEWRWMPEDLGKTYVWVNIPEFLVRVIKDDKTLHEERVVTGRTATQTPIFSNMMRTVVFQPVWNVPESIKVNELLPKLRSGGNPIAGQGLRLERNGREVSAWDIDWYRQDIRNFHIYQPPGDGNVLGVVKFLFPNKHSVYLHDTPSKRLFNEKVRTFSHGCMRVRNPVRLAEVVMAEDKGWDADKIKELISSGPENNDVALDHPLPVHVTYFTMWVDDAGDVKKFADVYGHEKRIKLGLQGRWGEIEKNPDHLAPADPNVVASRDDWGDVDASAPVRPRARYYAGPNGYPRNMYRYPPGYRPSAQPSKPSLGNFISKIFGAD